MYGIYLLEAGDTARSSRRMATEYYEGRAFKMRDLPIGRRDEGEEVFALLIGALPPQLVTMVALEVNGVILEPGDKIRLRPPIDMGMNTTYRVRIDTYEFDIVVFQYEMECEIESERS